MVSKIHCKIVLLLIILLPLVNACNFGGSEPATTEPPAPTDTATSLAAEPSTGDETDTPAVTTSGGEESSLPANSSTTATILARGKLRAGVKYDFKPFGYLDENGEVAGFDVDIVKEFARRWLGDETAVELVQVTSADRIPRLAAGEVDLVAASMTHKRDRDKTIDFSQTYFLDGQSLLVRKESGIETVANLGGKTVAAIQGSTSIDQIEQVAAEQNVDLEVLPFQAYPQAIDALTSGQVDALTTDSVALSQFAQDNPDLHVVGGRFTQEPYGIGAPQGDSDFREFVDITLQEMKADGTYDEIYRRWFPADEPYDIRLLPGETPYPTLGDIPAQITQPAASRIEDILNRERLIAGVKYDFKPFGYLDENGDVAGFDVDIVKEFAKRWLGDETAVELVKVTSADRIPRLAAGEVDLVAASMTHKRDRDETIDFSQTYFLDGQSLLVRKESGIEEAANLDGKTVAAIEGSTSIDQIREEADEQGVAIEVLPFQGYPQAIDALAAGQVDALTTDSVALSQFAQDNPDLHVVGGRFTQEPYGIGVPKNDSHFRELVNFTLQEMKKDGTYDAIYQKWFPADEPYDIQILPGDADYVVLPYAGEGVTLTAKDSAIRRIREQGQLIAGVKYDFKPFGFLDEGGQVIGFDVDLIQAMADTWGVEVEFVQVTSANRIPKLAAGEVDIVAASMTHKKERDETIDFSQTYFLDGQSLLVRRDSGIEDIQGLDGGTVAAIQGSTSIDQIQAYADANDVSIELLPFQEYPGALEALKAGDVDALTTDSVALSQFAQDNPDLDVVGGLFTEEPYGMGLPSGDSYFNNLVNFTLQQLKADGAYDRLYKKWFGDEAEPYPVEILPGAWPHTFADSPTPLDKPVQSKVNQILAEGTFVAGVKYDFKPFGFLNEDNQVVGFDIDIMKEFAKRWLGDANAVELVQVTSANRIGKLAAGEVDIVAASMTHKQERDETIDFSQTYFLDGQSLLVRRDADIEGIKDLEGKTVAAIQGSTSIDQIKAYAREQGVTIEILPFNEYPPSIEALKQGHVDALTTDSVALSQFAQDNPELVVVGELFTEEPYGIGLPNYDDRFRDLVNFTLQEMKLDGTYDRLYEKWFGRDAAPYDIEIWPGEDYLGVNTVPMLRIPAGEFIRGSNDGFPDEAPEQTIFLDEFYIDQYEVTNRLYEQCVKEARCPAPRYTRSVSFAEYYANSDFGNHSVVWVTWEDAQAYCNFAGKRLPTEAEWEKAARGPDGWLYPWGDADPTGELTNYDYNEQDVEPVGSYPDGVSAYGVNDMAGNVREWVADWYRRDYYAGAPTDNPPGPADGVTKVLRGGAWNEDALALKTTRRKDFLPDSFDSNLGFRCASSTFPPSR